MGPFLLDANVLIALAWPQHVLHVRAGRWFASRGHSGWATCPITQTAFVRILSNPAFSPNALTPQNALRLLEKNLKHSKHQFWNADVSLCDAVAKMELRLTGHQQITDAYLLGLAMHKKGRLATLDRSIRGLLAPEIKPQNYIEFIG